MDGGTLDDRAQDRLSWVLERAWCAVHMCQQIKMHQAVVFFDNSTWFF